MFVIVISPAGSGRVIGNPSPQTQRGGNATQNMQTHVHAHTSLLNAQIQKSLFLSIQMSV